MNEQVLLYGPDRTCVGILSSPVRADNQARPAVILLNSLLTPRFGPNRLYVKIARQLAAAGFHVFRIDLSGVGDSPQRTDNLSFEERAFADVEEAMRTLTDACGAERFILMGHCSGGLLSLVAATRNQQVVGVAAINPEGGNAEWAELDAQRKRAKYFNNRYGPHALRSARIWQKVLSGKADYSAIARNVLNHVFARSLSSLVPRRAPKPEGQPSKEMLESQALMRILAERQIPLLFVHPEGSTGYEYLQRVVGAELQQLTTLGLARIEVLTEADHEFNTLDGQQRLIAVVQDWTQMWAQQLAQQALSA